MMNYYTFVLFSTYISIYIDTFRYNNNHEKQKIAKKQNKIKYKYDERNKNQYNNKMPKIISLQ